MEKLATESSSQSTAVLAWYEDLRARVEALPLERLLHQVPTLAPPAVGYRLQLLRLLAGLVMFATLLVVIALRLFEPPLLAKLTVAITLLVSALLNLGLTVFSKRRKQAQIKQLEPATFRVGLACEYWGLDQAFEEGNTEVQQLIMIATTDPHLIGNLERFEWLTAQCVYLTPFAVSFGLSDRVPEDVAAAGQAFWKGLHSKQRVALPASFAGGDAWFVETVFDPELSPNGYVDRAMWPVLLTDLPGQAGQAHQLPASLWWNEASDELTEFHGHLGAAYAELHALPELADA